MEISAYSFGTNTNSWAIRDSSIDTGIGNDTVILNASDLAVSIGEAIEPAYGAVNSSINLGSGDDSLFINASGEALSIGWSWDQSALAAAYGVIDSTIDAGSGNDFIDINVSSISNAENGWWGNLPK